MHAIMHTSCTAKGRASPGQLCLVVLVGLHGLPLLLPVHLFPLLPHSTPGCCHSPNIRIANACPRYIWGASIHVKAAHVYPTPPDGLKNTLKSRGKRPHNGKMLRLRLVLRLLGLGLLLLCDLLLPGELYDLQGSTHTADACRHRSRHCLSLLCIQGSQRLRR